jgi:DNA polymerase (family 10)
VQCDLRGVEDSQFAFALHYFTGSKAHNIAMRRRAIAQGFKLNEYALEGSAGNVPCAQETDLFAALGLLEIPPELREDQGEIEAAAEGRLPTLLVRSDLMGTFHCHTTWSDGSATVEDMAKSAMAAGLGYLGIADHSRAAAYAGGLSIERVQAQWEEVDALNQKFGKTFRIFKGIECDILADGSLDYPDEVLAGFDYVVASVHSSFTMPRDQMTARIIKAIEHPLVTMLGHPTGRLLLTRDGYQIGLDAVIEAAARSSTIIEINANPHRLDLDASHCRRARALGVRIAINPDAHSPSGFDDLNYGVGVARRAWLERGDIVNAAPAEDVDALFKSLRENTHAR